jgi:hypothetical protein
MGAMHYSHYEVGASSPSTHAVLKLIHVLWVAADNEGSQTVQGGEVEVTGWGTNGGLAISFHEANPPQASVAVEVQEEAGRGRIVDRTGSLGRVL